MNTKYTPGPWEVLDLNNGYVAIGKQVPDKVNGWGTYKVYVTKPIEVGTGYAPHIELLKEEYQANAHLIAAAPDLLRILKVARDFISRDYVATRTEDNYKRSVLETINEIIPKAEGR